MGRAHRPPDFRQRQLVRQHQLDRRAEVPDPPPAGIPRCGRIPRGNGGEPQPRRDDELHQDLVTYVHYRVARSVLPADHHPRAGERGHEFVRRTGLRRIESVHDEQWRSHAARSARLQHRRRFRVAAHSGIQQRVGLHPERLLEQGCARHQVRRGVPPDRIPVLPSPVAARTDAVQPQRLEPSGIRRHGRRYGVMADGRRGLGAHHDSELHLVFQGRLLVLRAGRLEGLVQIDDQPRRALRIDDADRREVRPPSAPRPLRRRSFPADAGDPEGQGSRRSAPAQLRI